jgi:uncharacterized protein
MVPGGAGPIVEELTLIAPAFKDRPLSWKWMEETKWYWPTTFEIRRHVKTTSLHGLQDGVISPKGSRSFVADDLLPRDPSFPCELRLIPGGHRMSGPEHLALVRRLMMRES